MVGILEIAFGVKCKVGNLIAPEITKLYVLEWFCNKGIGRKLLEKAHHEIKKSGNTTCWLWLLKTNKRAHSFYLKNGYVDIGTAQFVMEKNTYTNLVMINPDV